MFSENDTAWVARSLNAIGEHRNVFLIIAATSVGVLVPQLGAHMEILTTPLVAFLIFTSFSGLYLRKLNIQTYLPLIVLCLLVSYVLIPAVGFYIAASVVSDGATVGFGIMLAAPTTAGSAIVWTRLSGGDVQLSTVVSILSILLCPIVTPVLLEVLIGDSLVVPFVSVLSEIVVIIAGGLLLSVLIPDSSVSESQIEWLSTIAIALLVYIGVSGIDPSGTGASSIVRIGVVSVAIALAGLLIAIGSTYVFRLSRASLSSVYLTGSMKNLGIAILLSIPYDEPSVMFAIIAFYIAQQILAATFSDFA